MPTRPPLHSEIQPTNSGIIDDPYTGERIIASSRRPDGTYRKEIRIRPGYTPDEDVSKFRSARQQEADASALPKGSVVGMSRPDVAAAQSALQQMSATQRKNAKRKEKRKEERLLPRSEDDVPDSWDAADASLSLGIEAGSHEDDGITMPGGAGVERGKTRGEESVARTPPPNAATVLFKSALRSSSGTPPAPSPPSMTNNTSIRTFLDPPRSSGIQTSATPSAGSPGRGLFTKAVGAATKGEAGTGEKRSRALRKKIQQAEQLRQRAEGGEELLPEQQAKVASVDALQEELAELEITM